MPMEYATITGRVTKPSSDVGVNARIVVTPMTTRNALAFPDPGEARLTWGPDERLTDAAGNLPTGDQALKIPLHSWIGGVEDGAPVYWRFEAIPLDKGGKPWIMGHFTISEPTTLQALMAAQIGVEVVDPVHLVTLMEVLERAEEAAERAEEAADEAEAIVLAEVGPAVDTALDTAIEDHDIVVGGDARINEIVRSSRFQQVTVDRSMRRAKNAIKKGGHLADDAVEAIKISMGRRRAHPTKVVTVAKDGSGDATSLAAGLALITDSSIHNPYRLEYKDPHYLEVGLQHKEGVEWVSICPLGTHIEGYLPPDSDDATIEATSTIDANSTIWLENTLVTIQNGRYPIHADAKNDAKRAVIQGFRLDLHHRGNQEAIDWRTANPGSGLDPNTVWNNLSALGLGTSSGQELYFDAAEFIGDDALTHHSFEDFDHPCVDIRRGCKIIGTGPAAMISLSSLGSGQPTTVMCLDSLIEAQFIRYSDQGFRSLNPDLLNGDRNEYRFVSAGCTHGPLGYDSNMVGRVLKITSAETAGTSTIRVSGTAADALFADLTTTIDGGNGLAGYAYGRPDISGDLTGPWQDQVVANTLGRLLGDCSAVAKTLTVSVDGGAGIDVDFTADHTADTNATILGLINAALGAAATASEYDPVKGEGKHFPDILEDLRHLENTGAAAVGRFHAVKQTPAGVAVMTTTDPASAFYGVAVEPIQPGARGRILVRGRLKSVVGYLQIPGVTTAVDAGDVVYHSPTTDGQFTITPNHRPAMISTIDDWADFGPGILPERRYGKVKKADQTIPNMNSTVHVVDNELVLEDVLPGYYQLDAVIHATATAAADFDYGFDLPADSVMAWTSDAQATGATTSTGARNQLTFSGGSTPTAGMGAAKWTLRPGGGVYIGSRGDVSLKWAQGAPELSDVTVHALSSIRLVPLD